MSEQDKQTRRNAFLYCKLRDDQFALYDGYVKSQGLVMNTFMVLNALFYAKDGLTQRQLREMVHQSKQNVNLVVKRLAADGHVTIGPDGPNERSKVVRLTEEGRAWCERPVRHITVSENAAMASLPPEEQERLVDLSRKFTDKLAELVRGEGE